MDSAFIEDSHPVFTACEIGDLEVVRNFLNQGGSVYAESSKNSPIASIATAKGRVEIVELLIRNGLSLTKPFNKFGEPLVFLPVRANDVVLADFFFSRGVPLSISNSLGMHSLDLAAAGGLLDILKYLVAHGVDVNQLSPGGSLAIREAARNRKLEAMDFLVKSGADLEKTDKSGINAMLGAAKGGKADVVQWLIAKGAKRNVTDRYGKSALDWAKANGHTEVITILTN